MKRLAIAVVLAALMCANAQADPDDENFVIVAKSTWFTPYVNLNGGNRSLQDCGVMVDFKIVQGTTTWTYAPVGTYFHTKQAQWASINTSTLQAAGFDNSKSYKTKWRMRPTVTNVENPWAAWWYQISSPWNTKTHAAQTTQPSNLLSVQAVYAGYWE